MKATYVLALALVGGCMADDLGSTEPSDSSDNGYTNVAKIAGNGITPQQLWDAGLTANVLDATSLTQLASTISGRAVGPYIVGCALAAGHNVTTSYVNDVGITTNITFTGAIGLVDGWTSAALTTAQQQFLSSCVLARTNRFGANVTLSLRGPSATLNTAAGETTNYPLQEGAFFGNVFGTQTFYVAACKGSGDTTIYGRDCAKPGPLGTDTLCGYVYAGLCSNVCTSGTYFTNCAANSTTYGTPVTTYLAN
ncbi:MAG: hypothetical protein H0W68_09920 [Gemmatimonadaceae bacterium]|nr:hypothetical protein [Gemmatimonadaceae bacterium]